MPGGIEHVGGQAHGSILHDHRHVFLAYRVSELPPSPVGEALFQELLWVHAAVRRDLDTVRRLAAEVADDLPPAELQAELESLETNGPLWRLKFGCQRYCRFVHMHHGAEDALLFPVLRDTAPEIGSVVDRLEGEHRQVSVLLDNVEAAANELSEVETGGARARVVQSLDALEGHLLAHLDFEEASAGPAIRSLTSVTGLF
jgi:hemerythrin HHE cation binding domain-containing protein